jgi:protein associated with RNAse G/E
MKAGDQIQGHACKADGTIYRSWHTTIESVNTDSIVTISPAGSMVIDKTKLGDHPIKHHLRSYYWFDKLYNLIEVFDVNMTLVQIYINIASLPEFINGEIRFKDHELDVVRDMPGPAQIVDEDEFAEAVLKYQYSEEFQKKMYAVAQEALALADHWTANPAPVFGGNNVK